MAGLAGIFQALGLAQLVLAAGLGITAVRQSRMPVMA